MSVESIVDELATCQVINEYGPSSKGDAASFEVFFPFVKRAEVLVDMLGQLRAWGATFCPFDVLEIEFMQHHAHVVETLLNLQGSVVAEVLVRLASVHDLHLVPDFVDLRNVSFVVRLKMILDLLVGDPFQSLGFEFIPRIDFCRQTTFISEATQLSRRKKDCLSQQFPTKANIGPLT